MFCYNFHILESLASGEITHHLTSYEHFGNAKKFNRFFLDDLETVLFCVTAWVCCAEGQGEGAGGGTRGPILTISLQRGFGFVSVSSEKTKHGK